MVYYQHAASIPGPFHIKVSRLQFKKIRCKIVTATSKISSMSKEASFIVHDARIHGSNIEP